MLPVLAASLGLTLLFELLYAAVWGLRGRDLGVCALVNCITNPVVVTLHSFFPAPAVTAALELGAVVTEALLYRTWGRDVYRPWLFALLVNAFSFFLGVLINHLFLS